MLGSQEEHESKVRDRGEAGVSDEEALKLYGQQSGARVLDPEDVAASVVYALRQPDHVAVNEILVEPRDEPI